VFRIGAGRKEKGVDDATAACSFCNSSQKQVRYLVAGPTVYICDNCVRICVDIIAGGGRAEHAKAGPGGLPGPRWSSELRCTLCGMPVTRQEAVVVENLALLCQNCTSAVQAAAEQTAANEDKPE
jgi:hypothetical protein